MTNILLIEDNEQLQKYMTEYLTAYEYHVTILTHYENILDTIEKTKPELILLDINLPVYDGFYFLKLIRKKFSTPIIIISARSEESEQIRGIESGADDYMTKPFSIGILLAKINALLRRVDKKDTQRIEYQNIILYKDQLKIEFQNQTLDLTKNEFKVLQVLIESAGEIVTREQLLEELWDDISFVDDNTLTVNMTRVKKKLNELGLYHVISTKRGVGYVFDVAFEKNNN